MPFCLGNYTTHNMEEYAVVSDISVVDVYDIASEIGKECEKLIDSYGVDSVTNLMPKVIHALELLENLATKNERENTTVQELQAKISQLESDKIEKAEDRQRFEKVFYFKNFITSTYIQMHIHRYLIDAYLELARFLIYSETFIYYIGTGTN